MPVVQSIAQLTHFLPTYLTHIATAIFESQNTEADRRLLKADLTRYMDMLEITLEQDPEELAKMKEKLRKEVEQHEKRMARSPSTSREEQDQQGKKGEGSQGGEGTSQKTEQNGEDGGVRTGDGSSSKALVSSHEEDDESMTYRKRFDNSSVEQLLESNKKKDKKLDKALEQFKHFQLQLDETEKRVVQMSDLQAKKLRAVDMNLDNLIVKAVERAIKPAVETLTAQFMEAIASCNKQPEIETPPPSQPTAQEMEDRVADARSQVDKSLQELNEIEARFRRTPHTTEAGKRAYEKLMEIKHALEKDRVYLQGDLSDTELGSVTSTASTVVEPIESPRQGSTTEPSTFHSSPAVSHSSSTDETPVRPSLTAVEEAAPRSDTATTTSAEADQTEETTKDGARAEESHEGGDTTSKSNKKKKKGKKGSVSTAATTTEAGDKEVDQPAETSQANSTPVASTSTKINSPTQQQRPSTPFLPLNEPHITPDTPPSPDTTTPKIEEANQASTDGSKKKGKKNKKGKGKAEEHADANASAGVSPTAEAPSEESN